MQDTADQAKNIHKGLDGADFMCDNISVTDLVTNMIAKEFLLCLKPTIFNTI